MTYYTCEERINIIIDIMKKLKNFKLMNGEIINLYNNEYTFIKELKIISNEYIRNGKEQKGKLFFEEIGKNVEYIFPEKSYKKSLFVIRHN
jgi:hypothetical protein